MTQITFSASSGEHAATIDDDNGNVFDRRRGVFTNPDTCEISDVAIPLSPINSTTYGVDIPSNLPAGTHNYRLFTQAGLLGRDAVDGTRTATATGTVTKAPETRGPDSTAVASVEAAGTPSQNGAALLAAYDYAKTLTPNGAALSATNRASVVIEPGVYDIGTDTLTLDTQFVDLIGLGRDNVLITGSDHVLRQTADDVLIEGLTVKTTSATTGDAAWYPDTALANAKIRNVKLISVDGGDAVHANKTFSGIAENVVIEFTGGQGTGTLGIIAGTARNVRGDHAWGQVLASTAKLYNCEGATGSFASKDASAKTLFCVVNDAAYASND